MVIYVNALFQINIHWLLVLLKSGGMKLIQYVFFCVDDFSIKYFNQDYADHLLQSIGKHYQYTTDWKGHNYCGITLNWNYPDGYVEISILGYVENYKSPLTYPSPSAPVFTIQTYSYRIWSEKYTAICNLTRFSPFFVKK